MKSSGADKTNSAADAMKSKPRLMTQLSPSMLELRGPISGMVPTMSILSATACSCITHGITRQRTW